MQTYNNTERQRLEAQCLQLLHDMQLEHGDAGVLALGYVPGADLSLALLREYQAFALQRAHARHPEFTEDGVRLMQDFLQDLQGRVAAAKRQLAEPTRMPYGHWVSRSTRRSTAGQPGGKGKRKKTF